MPNSHVEIFNGEWNIFIWPCLLIWVLDRALRIFRILAFNWRFWDITAMATYDAASNLIRLEIPCEQSILKPQPGTYYYIYVLNNILFAHQNHPFTLAYVSSPNHTDINESGTQSYVSHPSPIQPSRSSPSPPARTPSPAISESSSLLLPPHPTSLSPSLTFLIRPYEGITSRLRKTFLNQPRTLRVWVEGPYGTTTTPHPLHAFPALLFIAGGTGIAVTLSHLPSLLASTPQMISIHVVWAVREHAFLGDVLRRDIPAEVLLDERVRFTVHVTQDAELKDDVALGGEGGEGSGLLGDRLQANVEVKAGRPDVNAAVAHEAKVASGKRLAVVACGPAQMADDARRGCVRALGKGFRGVEYFEESFKW
jgi:NAD(P)H-flavin reductase